MKEREFNLLDEPWILALNIRGETVSLSLKEVFTQAHELETLAGELPTQDIAVLRLLLAVLHCVFGREVTDTNAVDVWKKLRDAKQFPADRITQYLEKYRDRFWLFHPEYPFYQVADSGIDTCYKLAGLLGDISDSNNPATFRLFHNRSGNGKEEIGYAEAARWLICYNSYSGRVKDNRKEKESVDFCWLGLCSIIYAISDNLFDTLMLNLVLCDEDGKSWEPGGAVWEKSPSIKRQLKIPVPNSQAELLTLQSRRIRLVNKDGKVANIGSATKKTETFAFSAGPGEYFVTNPKNDDYSAPFAEQMTLWNCKTQKNKPPIYSAKKTKAPEQIWRDFSALLSSYGNARLPGIVSWLARLQDEGYISNLIRWCVVTVEYDSQGYVIDRIGTDTIAVNASVLSELYKADDSFIVHINKLLENTDKAVIECGKLASQLVIAAGADRDNKGKSPSADGASKKVKVEAYFRLDQPFREWLTEIDPYEGEDGIEKKENEWRDTVVGLLMKYGEEIVGNADIKAHTGRIKGNKAITAASAYDVFKRGIRKAFDEN